MNYDIAIDIGGTQLRAACYPEHSLQPSVVKRTPTQGDGQPPLERLLGLVRSVWPQNGAVRAMAAAVAGPVDPYQGILLEAPNIPGWTHLPLQKHLQDCFHVPVALGNDANLAALGEWKYGAGQGHQDMIYITISTGIGGGVITGGQLLLGVRGLGAEMGHITVLPDGPLCGCGQPGHLEAIAAGPAIARWTQEQLANGAASTHLPRGKKLSAKDVSLAASQGDPLAVAALQRAGAFLGRAMADFLHVFNPSALIFGGGVSQSGPLLFDPLHTALRSHVISPDYVTGLKIANAALGDEVGLMGALALAQSIK